MNRLFKLCFHEAKYFFTYSEKEPLVIAEILISRTIVVSQNLN